MALTAIWEMSQYKDTGKEAGNGKIVPYRRQTYILVLVSRVWKILYAVLFSTLMSLLFEAEWRVS